MNDEQIDDLLRSSESARIKSQIAWKDLSTGEVFVNEEWDTDEPSKRRSDA